MIELKHISKQFQSDEFVLKDVNLQIKTGEIFGIIGKSGAGKSTLIRCINLLERPSSGSVLIADEDITHYPDTRLREIRHQIGMIFQHFNLLQRKSVWDNIALPLQCANVPHADINKRVSELCELVGLADKQKHYPGQLSGGQKQRVAIARALASKPKIILCDEATSALDPETTTAILKLLKAINQELNITLVMITHEMSVIKSICDRVAVIDRGLIVEVNTPLQLLLSPESATAKEFMSKAIKSHIPAGLLNHLIAETAPDHVALAHLAFIGDTASEPIIADLAMGFSLKVNILQADIEYINNVSLGHMLVELPASNQQMQQAIDYFKQHNVQVEVIGYVPRHVL